MESRSYCTYNVTFGSVFRATTLRIYPNLNNLDRQANHSFGRLDFIFSCAFAMLCVASWHLIGSGYSEQRKLWLHICFCRFLLQANK